MSDGLVTFFAVIGGVFTACMFIRLVNWIVPKFYPPLPEEDEPPGESCIDHSDPVGSYRWDRHR